MHSVCFVFYGAMNQSLLLLNQVTMAINLCTHFVLFYLCTHFVLLSHIDLVQPKLDSVTLLKVSPPFANYHHYKTHPIYIAIYFWTDGTHSKLYILLNVQCLFKMK